MQTACSVIEGVGDEGEERETEGREIDVDESGGKAKRDDVIVVGALDEEFYVPWAGAF